MSRERICLVAMRGDRPVCGQCLSCVSNKLDQIVEWLIETGFPHNWSTTIPAPAWLVEPLAAAYRDPADDLFDVAAIIRSEQDFT